MTTKITCAKKSRKALQISFMYLITKYYLCICVINDIQVWNQFVNQLTVSTKLLRWVKVTEVYGAKTLPYPLVSPKHISQICMWKKRRLQGNELETWAQLERASIGLSKLDNPMKRALTQIIKSRLLWMIAIEIKQRPVYSMPLRNHHTITHPFR